jgi:hypothetical protein
VLSPPSSLKAGFFWFTRGEPQEKSAGEPLAGGMHGDSGRMPTLFVAFVTTRPSRPVSFLTGVASKIMKTM